VVRVSPAFIAANRARAASNVQPRRRLSRAFVEAVLASGMPSRAVCAAIGMPGRQYLLPMLRREPFAASPKTLARMAALALVVGFTSGPIVVRQ